MAASQQQIQEYIEAIADGKVIGMLQTLTQMMEDYERRLVTVEDLMAGVKSDTIALQTKYQDLLNRVINLEANLYFT